MSRPVRASGQSRKRGSAASDKQVAFAVKHRTPVAAISSSGLVIARGWICGADDYHWIVVDDDLNTILVHKTIPALRIVRGTSMDDYSRAADLRAATDPYRDFVLRTYFHHGEESGDDASLL